MQYPSSPMYGTTGNVAGAGQAVEQPWQNDYHSEYVPPNTGYSHQYSNSVSTSQYNGGGYTQVNYSDKNINKDLINKMNAMKMTSGTSGSNPASNYDNVNSQAYGGYNNYPVPSTAAYTAVVGATTVPAIATSQSSRPPSVNYAQRPEQYTPDASSGPNYAAYSNYSTNTAPGLTTDITASATNYKQYADQPNNYYPPQQAAGNYYNYASTGVQPPQSQPAATDSVNQYPTQYQYYPADASNQAYTPNAYAGYSSGNYASNYNTSAPAGSSTAGNYTQYPYSVETNAESYPYVSGSAQPPALNTATPPPANYNQNLPNSPYAANSTPPPTQQTPQATPTPTPPPPA
ncbi:uncharacterized protein, partial [Atheta coriaria]|uniref:uncharacterized protein n=1 Tax=Dalotia coriaria TaxID=877792 RepID=UPI0031F43BE2